MNESLLITLKKSGKEILRFLKELKSCEWTKANKKEAFWMVRSDVSYEFYHWWLSKRTTSRFASFFRKLSREDLSQYLAITPQDSAESLESLIEGRIWRDEMGY